MVKRIHDRVVEAIYRIMYMSIIIKHKKIQIIDNNLFLPINGKKSQ